MIVGSNLKGSRYGVLRHSNKTTVSRVCHSERSEESHSVCQAVTLRFTQGDIPEVLLECLRHFGTGRGIRAFTIVELLVVMAVIALLMSILIPALGRAKDHARLVSCKSHLRCISSGALMYADEHGSLLPFDDMLGPGYTGAGGVWVENPHDEILQALEKYVHDPKTFYCPSETNPEYGYSRGNFEKGTIGYFYFSVKNNPIDNGELSRFLRWEEEGVIEYPRQLTNLMDTATWVVSDMWFSGQPTPHRWYDKGVNYATLDASVHMVYRSPRKEFR